MRASSEFCRFIYNRMYDSEKQKLCTKFGDEVINALLTKYDPMAPNLVPTRPPDGQLGPSFLYRMNGSETWADTRATPGTWDVVFNNNVVWGAGGQLVPNSCTTNSNVPTRLDGTTTGTNYSTNSAWHGRANPAGTTAYSGEVVPTGLQSKGIGATSGVLTAEATVRSRVVGSALKVVNTTAPINASGSLMVARQHTDVVVGGIDMNVSADTNDQITLKRFQGPLGDAQGFQRLGGDTWKAVDGAYAIAPFRNDNAETHMIDSTVWAMYANTVNATPVYSDVDYTQPHDIPPKVGNNCGMTAIGLFGLSPESTLTTTSVTFVEVFPGAENGDYGFATRAPAYNPVFIEIDHIMRKTVPAYCPLMRSDQLHLAILRQIALIANHLSPLALQLALPATPRYEESKPASASQKEKKQKKSKPALRGSQS